MRRHALIFLLLIVFVPQGSRALIFGPDDRVVVSSQPASLYGSIGVIFGGSVSGHATAFLVSDCHVLTVRHAFPRGDIRGLKTTFAADASGDVRHWAVSEARVVQAGYSAASEPLDPQRDWAVLRLRRCLGRRFGTVLLASQLPEPGHRIQLAGYPNDKSLADGLILDPKCQVRRIEEGFIRHDCATQPGNSGSPIFDVVEDKGRKKLRVFGLNHAGHSFGVPGANLRTPVTSYYPAYAASALPLHDRNFETSVGVRRQVVNESNPRIALCCAQSSGIAQ